jgi:hypothetical protein
VRHQIRLNGVEGFNKFKIKVGKSIEEDKKRLEFVRSVIGYEKDMVSSTAALKKRFN